MPTTDETAPGAPMPPDELGQRLVYALLLPAVRMALAVGMPSKELLRWTELALYHEARRRGFKNHEIAAQLDVSIRKVAELSRRLKDNFLSPEREHGLPRRIEFMLWAEPASAARIKQTFPDEDEAEIDAALAKLEAQGRIRQVQHGRTTRYERVGAQAVLVQDQLLARIDGLNNLLGNVADAVHARFVAEPPPESFARTISLRVRKDELPRLRALYDDVIWEVLQRLDESAHRAPEDVETLSLSILWAPHAHLEGLLDARGDRDAEERDED